MAAVYSHTMRNYINYISASQNATLAVKELSLSEMSEVATQQKIWVH